MDNSKWFMRSSRDSNCIVDNFKELADIVSANSFLTVCLPCRFKKQIIVIYC